MFLNCVSNIYYSIYQTKINSGKLGGGKGLLSNFVNFAAMAVREPILECVPNISEGKDPERIEELANLIASQPGVQLLHKDASPSANRTVFTFAGRPQAVTEAAFQLIRLAAERIDMRHQQGIHPRIGATDVCPLVPLGSMTREEAVRHSLELGARVGEELGIPVYLYEHSARHAHRRTLPQIRKGEYEGLKTRVGDPDWIPDFGPPIEGNSRSGVTVIGARDILVAFNISLDSPDLGLARRIASRIRESGYRKISPEGSIRVPGIFPRLRAIGWYQEDFGKAQVSMNFLDYRKTSPTEVWKVCVELAAESGVNILGSELVGLMPKAVLEDAAMAYRKSRGIADPIREEEGLEDGIRFLGLDHLHPFSIRERILEFNLEDKGIII